jgi:hypothetical protein
VFSGLVRERQSFVDPGQGSVRALPARFEEIPSDSRGALSSFEPKASANCGFELSGDIAEFTAAPITAPKLSIVLRASPFARKSRNKSIICCDRSFDKL